jgi:selenide,water dikinase
MEIKSHPNLLVGIDHHDDSAVYKLSEDVAIVQSLDFFTPIVDDPFTFGQITAANALSDIYAMGARPITAMNIVAFPVDDLPNQILKDILKGGLDKINESGAVLAGGHSIKDDELKYGLSVTGVVHPEKMISNKGALPGDKLILTKALGTGIVATALKREIASEAEVDAMVASMIELNKAAAEAAVQFPIHAMTDVTGFGLVGHLLELLKASQVDATLDTAALPLLPGALHWASKNVVPGGLKANLKFYRPQLSVPSRISKEMEMIAVDPQTSGGLLISCPADSAEALLQSLHKAGVDAASIIGEITSTSLESRISLS